MQTGYTKTKKTFLVLMALIAWFAVLYCVYTLIRGNLSGYYPYPFMNVNEGGLDKVLINIGAMWVLFLFISFLLVGISKARTK